MECAFLNLLEQGERLLVLQNGIWGHRAAELGRRLQLDVHREEVPEGEVIGLDAVEKVQKFLDLIFLNFKIFKP